MDDSERNLAVAKASGSRIATAVGVAVGATSYWHDEIEAAMLQAAEKALKEGITDQNVIRRRIIEARDGVGEINEQR